MNRIVVGFAIAAPVLNLAPFAGGQQGLLFGLDAGCVPLAPPIQDVPGRQPVGFIPVRIAGVVGPIH